MKIISYDPKEITNISSFMNRYIDEYRDEKFLMFVFDDVIGKAKDKAELVRRYEELMLKLDLPYAFFPYYAHFNKIFPGLIGKPSPRIAVRMKDGFMFDVVQDPCFGLLVVDVEKLNRIGFRFNEEYRLSFYIQDLISRCFSEKLYMSATYFIDVHSSYELFSDDFRDGYVFDVKAFLEEKRKFFEANSGVGVEQINDFVAGLKERYAAVGQDAVAGDSGERREEEGK